MKAKVGAGVVLKRGVRFAFHLEQGSEKRSRRLAEVSNTRRPGLLSSAWLFLRHRACPQIGVKTFVHTKSPPANFLSVPFQMEPGTESPSSVVARLPLTAGRIAVDFSNIYTKADIGNPGAIARSRPSTMSVVDGNEELLQ